MSLISEMPRDRNMSETNVDSSSFLHARRAQGVIVRIEQDQDKEEDHLHREFDQEAHFKELSQDGYLDRNMEGSILHRPRPRKVVKAPVLPQRSEKRISMILDKAMLEMQNIGGSQTGEDDVSRLDQEDPHQLYLSSEEDASLSDDYDDSDSLLDFEEIYSGEENEGSAARPSSRRSKEITAKAVSFMVVKPQIIEIHIPSSHTVTITPAEATRDLLDDASPTRTTKAAPLPTSTRSTMRRPPPLNLTDARPMSMATTSSYISSYNTPPPSSNSSMMNLSTTGFNPTRKTSRLASLVTSTKASLSGRSSSLSATSLSSTHSFLDSDPFAQSANSPNPPLTPTHPSAPSTPKTPSSQSSAWKKSLSKTLSKANRKPSLHQINASYNSSLSSSNTQRTSTSSSISISALSRLESNAESHVLEVRPGSEGATHETECGDRIDKEPFRRAETMPLTPSPREAPVSYSELMHNRIPPPIPDNAPKHVPREGRKSFSLGMGLGRKKSMKRL
ncbi:uncharacterized protein RSE6_11887 [Rhynchosporium secalis]|uniref:Uncharacterized protein n=1 Tax=Rhynchosporium secalis TaxID=38038 RepID=A0A1E1MP02_RHYSE|nr:uncharacterized protein RSE6_11887 [Rhynchosporium secalis]